MTVSILGCGWLGFPLAQKFVSEGMLVKGSTTSGHKIEILEKSGIKPFTVHVVPMQKSIPVSDFFNCETLIFNIPPKRNFKNVEVDYQSIVKQVIDKTIQYNIKNLVFIGSTSVYPLNNSIVKENDINPEKPSGKALVVAEKIVLQQKTLYKTIIRFGGLIGYERNALSLLKRKKEIYNASSPLNLIHRDDCVEIIYKIVNERKWGYIFNACADKHPMRKEFYLNACKKHNIPIPVFKDTDTSYKIVSSDYLKEILNYKFKYPNPLEIDKHE